MLRITLDNGKEYFSSGNIDSMNDAISHSIDNDAPLVGFVRTNGKKIMVKISAIEEISEFDYIGELVPTPSIKPNISITFGEPKQTNVDAIIDKIGKAIKKN